MLFGEESNMGKVIVVPSYEPIDGPLIFLAGPIQGAVDWQSEAIRVIHGLDSGLMIANPRTPPPWNLTLKLQADWEHHHLDHAAYRGVTMFWLAREHEHDCRRAFAQTSRFELGWTMMRQIVQKSHVVVGFDFGFSNERYLRYTLGRKAPGIPICPTLAETCREAVLLAQS